MNKTQHTPGPWESEHMNTAICAGTKTLARVYHGEGRSLNESKANAHLIAAAPELLDALVEITEDYAGRFDLESSSTNPGIKCVIAEARHVIKKATGISDGD